MLLNDKTGRDHELYQLFSQYPENLLLEVFNCMKNDGIITRIKKVPDFVIMTQNTKFKAGLHERF